MRILLTEKKDYLLGPDIMECRNMEDVYKTIKRAIYEDDDSIFIFVDWMFCNKKILRQIEMFRYEFEDFRIILDARMGIVLDLNRSLLDRLYFLTNISSNANEIYLNTMDYERNEQIDIDLPELRRLIQNEQALNTMVEYNYTSFESLIQTLLLTLEEMMYSNRAFSESNEKLATNNEDLRRKLASLEKAYKEANKNREELLNENLKLKYDNFIDNLGGSASQVSTPVMYIKAMLLKDEKYTIKMFEVLEKILYRKYKYNTCLVIIDDANALKLKPIRNKYSYIISDGRYNMNLGEHIITTTQHVKKLFENFEKFQGIKDLFIVLDLTLTTKTYVISDGAYLSVVNEKLDEGILKNVKDIKTLEEDDIKAIHIGDDNFNLEMNIAESKLFLEVEKIATEAIH